MSCLLTFFPSCNLMSTQTNKLYLMYQIYMIIIQMLHSALCGVKSYNSVFLLLCCGTQTKQWISLTCCFLCLSSSFSLMWNMVFQLIFVLQWERSLSAFCQEEFSIKTHHYHCCNVHGLAKWDCFEEDAPDPLYQPSGHEVTTTIQGFDFNPSSCQNPRYISLMHT